MPATVEQWIKQQLRADARALATCAICGKLFLKRGNRLTCSTLCSRVRRGVRHRVRYRTDPEYRARVNATGHNRRASQLGAGEILSPRELILYLIERDDGICGICRQLVTDTWGDLGPSIDHVIPLRPATGPPGEHALGNLQLAHLRCNLRKGNRVSARPGGNYSV